MNSWKKLILAFLTLLSAALSQPTQATITDTDVRTVTGAGNGVTTNYTIGFQFQDNDEVAVYKVNSSTLSMTELTYGVGASSFTITGGDPGTTVVAGTAPTSSEFLVLIRETSRTQSVNYDENSAFPAEDHEEQMDRMVQLLQEIGFKMDRAAAQSTEDSETAAEGDVLQYDGTRWRLLDLDAALVDASGVDLDRSAIAAGTANHVVINGSDGLLSSEATLAKSRGGFAQDNSSLTFPSSGTMPAFTPNQYGVLLSGSGAAGSVLAPNASTVYPLVSGGASANPSWALLTSPGGGTGYSSFINGQVLIGKSSDNTLAKATITAGAGVTITNGDGSITIAASGSSAIYDQSYTLQNVGLAASVGSSALTIALKQADGSSDCTAGATACNIGFRSATVTTGGYNVRSVTGALSLVISSGSTLGHAAGAAHPIFVYAIDNAGTVELAASTVAFEQGSVVTTTAEGGIGAADSNAVIYSTTARSNVPVRLLGRLQSNQATAGWYVTAISEISLWPFRIRPVCASAALSTGTVTISSASATKWQFPTVLYDPYNAFDETTNYRFTAPIADRYHVDVSGYIDQLTAGQDFELIIYKTGAAYKRAFTVVDADATQAFSLSADVDLAVGDYVEIFSASGGDTSYRQNSGGDSTYNFFNICQHDSR